MSEEVPKIYEDLLNNVGNYCSSIINVSENAGEFNERKLKISLKITREALQQVVDDCYNIILNLSKKYNDINYNNFVDNKF